MITLSKTNFTDCTANLFQGDVHQENSATNYLVLALNFGKFVAGVDLFFICVLHLCGSAFSLPASASTSIASLRWRLFLSRLSILNH